MTETTFKDLNLHPLTLKALKDRGYEIPTEIQAISMPVIMAGQDLVAIAQTGTGKTAGFTLPMMERFLKGRSRAMMPRGLVLAPTREIALQVEENFKAYGKYHHFTTALLIGGMSPVLQEKALARGVDVIIATPGRLLEHLEKGKVILQAIEMLVVDEADRMLDMGFIPDIENIIRLLPPVRQTVMFSATMPDAIRSLTERFLHLAKEITVTPKNLTAENIEQFEVVCPKVQKAKQAFLLEMMQHQRIVQAIIFANRKVEVDAIAKMLKQKGYNAAAIHGDFSQSERMQTLADFKESKIDLLVASDVAARGLHVQGLPVVINYDVPNNQDEYVHRVGRTGRAGALGKAYTLVSDLQQEQWNEIKSYTSATIATLNIGEPEKPAAEKREKKPANSKPVQGKSPDTKPAIKQSKTAATNGFCEDQEALNAIPDFLK